MGRASFLPRKVKPGHMARTDVHVPMMSGSLGERDWDEPVILNVHLNFCHSLTSSIVSFLGHIHLPKHCQCLLHGEHRHA